jgi:prepilin-type N-terminal cleavage/methylation domain-containing protein
VKHFGRRGFTLVELLIVLGIIVLLVTIILPAINRAREMGRRSVCISHIGQLTAAWLAYAGDNDGHLPNKWGSPAWDSGLTLEQLASEGRKALGNYHDPCTKIPRGQLWPYINNLKTYTCPDDPQEFHWVNLQGATPGGTGISYEVNPLLGDVGIPPGWPRPHSQFQKPLYAAYRASSVSRIKSPVHTYVFIEDIDCQGVAFPSVPIYPDHLATTLVPNGRLHLNASAKAEGCSISFADGHALFWNYAIADAGASAFDESAFREEFIQGSGPDVMRLAAWSGGPIPPQ